MVTPEDGAILGAAEMQTGVAGKVELPAFLEGNELPEGYKRINLVSPAREQLIRLDEAPGSETVCYVGKAGVRLRRKEGGKVFFSLLGFDLPKNVEHYEKSGHSGLTNIGPDGIPLMENESEVCLYSRSEGEDMRNNDLIRGVHSSETFNLFLPCTKDELGGAHYLSIKTRKGDIIMVNDSYHDNNVEITVPAAAMAKEGEVGEEIKTAEDVLTAEEKDFGAGLENLKKIEDRVGPVNKEELQARFVETWSSFYKLPVDSRMRVEIMIGVVGQLGAEGEKLRKAGKKDEEIFDEWLMQVFIPLYRRAGKKP